MVYHQTEMLAQIQAALNVISNPRAAADETRLQDALSIAEWWEPLAALARTELDALRARRYLGYAYRRGIDLTRLAQRLTRGAA